MQAIYGDASNVNLTAQKRLIRPAYAQHQATPYACSLDPAIRNASGTVIPPAIGTTGPFTYSAATFTLSGSIVPGTVMVRTSGEYVLPHPGGASTAIQPFGLLAQWVAGTFDNIKATNQVACWRGPDSTYDLLAPAWNDTGLAALVTAAASSGIPVLLYAGQDGRLCAASQLTGGVAGSAVPVARVIARTPTVLTIDLIV